jgi:class 3 adenylate cyclase/tetratricopeptide (TPR) repeat protein
VPSCGAEADSQLFPEFVAEHSWCAGRPSIVFSLGESWIRLFSTVTTCSNCGAENPATQKFCGECGTALAAICSSCGATNPPGQKFCGECGSSLAADLPVATRTAVGAAQPASVAERRLVSILFADLVGFTTLSESRDAEEVRELLSRYFDVCKRLISLYGGTVEKFIGDAVMAVWGTPVAQEDDAERAVRAALDLVAAVSALGDEVGAPELRARAGVLTGEAAVTLGAEGQGMVAGDLVNTASRIQAVAEPGSVLVGESTKRASEAAIAYADAGGHELKGKAEPVPLFRALRVTAGRAGALKAEGLEAPFVGRERELRLVKELFHSSAEEKKANLVSVVGIAGIGKSRLSWEFEKYIDGLAGDIWWHRGRCLSYGEGVAYWALAEMVRMRCEILEDEEAASARAKLQATIAEHIPDAEERAWVEPRLSHLLGLEEGTPGDQENLFSAWRILFERLAEQAPTILVFEDMQWADAGLLDFLEYLLEWSRNHPLFILALARPEFADKRPTWGAGKRSFASLYLEPLAPQAMSDLLTGLVPGLTQELREDILERAEGIPLYAVETVRMLLDRGLLEQAGNVYRPTGPIETLDVPETLHALIAARLDGLAPEERRLVQDGAVLGKTFTKQGLSAVTEISEEELKPPLAALVRKEVLSIQADPRSPERGQYSFLQDIVKRVAYETLSKRDRKAKHLAAARFLASTWGAEEDEIAEVVAAHYLDAYQAAPDDPDADELRASAREMVVRAAERAASLGANAEAQRAYERAIELADDPLVRADFEERAGTMAQIGARPDEAAAHYERAIDLLEAGGATHPAARVSARLAEILWDRGRLERALESMNQAFDVLSQEEPDDDLAALAAQLGRFAFFAGESDLAFQRIETALDLAEALLLPEVLSQALNSKAMMLGARDRPKESLALYRYALDVALEHDKPSAALRAYYNLADALQRTDRYQDAADCLRDGGSLARRVGNRYWEWNLLGQVYPLFALGRWDEVLAATAELPEDEWLDLRQVSSGLASVGVLVHAHRGSYKKASRFVDVYRPLETSADVQEQAAYGCGKASLLLARGDPAAALEVAEAALGVRDTMGVASEFVKEAFAIAVQAALDLGDTDKAASLIADVDSLPPGRYPQLLRAQTARFRAHIAAREGEAEEAERLFKGAIGLFRELAMPFYLAVTELESGEWLVAQGRGDEAEALLAEAREVFERLEAKPWLERVSILRRETHAVPTGS